MLDSDSVSLPLPVGPTGVAASDQIPALYQVVQETGAGPRFLTSWDTLEAALRDCRSLNERTGNPFKTILWGSGTPCQRCSIKELQFKKDNKLPSFIYHPAAIANYPEALPISAVYNHGTEVIFTPDGGAVNTALQGFAVADVGAIQSNPPAKQHRYWEAAAIAKHRAAQSNKKQYITATIKTKAGRKTVPVSVVHPRRVRQLSGFGAVETMLNPIISAVPPAEFQYLVRISQQYTGDL